MEDLSTNLNFKLSVDDKEKIRNKARIRRLSLSAYVRNMLLSEENEQIQ
tara:strand:- start:675 stop:821 length:147 start_codon:yes stop_codon:yes gene_type:complete